MESGTKAKDAMVNKITTKVLIIGGGAAGMSAALLLPGQETLLVEMSGSNSVFSPWNVMVKPGEELKREMLEAGMEANDRRILDTFVKRSSEITADLANLGINLKKSNIGLVPDYRLPGLEVKKILMERIASRGTKVIKGKVMNFLIGDRNRVMGVTVRLEDRSEVAVMSDYLLLAAGGLSSFFEYTTGEREATGSILALCLENNMALHNLEFLMFHPFLIVDRRFPRILVSGEILTQMDFVNEQGERFLSPKITLALKNNRHHYVFPQMVKEFYKESLKNRIFAVLACSPEWFEKYKKEDAFGSIFGKHSLSDIGRLEIHPAFHSSIGGLAVNEKMETSCENIYAAGEIVGGLHGINRIGGTAINEAWVEGKIAAEQINIKINQDNPFDEDKDIALKAIGDIGINEEIKALVWPALGPVKTKENLQKLLDALKQREMLTSSEKLIQKIAEISLLRKESVGAFFREDLPVAKMAQNSFVINNNIYFK